MLVSFCYYYFFFFNDTATTEIYTLSLHDALPIFGSRGRRWLAPVRAMRTSSAGRVDRSTAPANGRACTKAWRGFNGVDRKSTRLNSSHANISYAVFCLKKKKTYK